MKKKILYIITKSNFGGAQRYVFELATNMGADYEIAVACGGSGLLKQKLNDAGIKVYDIQNFERDINFIKECKSIQELRAIINDFEPNTLHLNSSKAASIGAFVGRLSGIPNIIFTAHGWPFYEKRHIVWQTFAWIFSYLTVLLSHQTVVVSKHDYEKHMMPLLSQKITHINTAVPDIHFKEKAEARAELFSEEIKLQHKNDMWAVSTGEFNKNKNLLMLLKAIQEANNAQNQKIFLSLMSDGEEREKLEKYVEENNMGGNVMFLGFIENAREYLKAFDVFLLPSLKEGLPYGLLEAGAAGLYCIASRVGGVPDVIEDGTDGVLVELNSKNNLVKALQQIPYDTSVLGNRLKAKIASEYPLKKMIEDTKKLYL